MSLSWPTLPGCLRDKPGEELAEFAMSLSEAQQEREPIN